MNTSSKIKSWKANKQERFQSSFEHKLLTKKCWRTNAVETLMNLNIGQDQIFHNRCLLCCCSFCYTFFPVNFLGGGGEGWSSIVSLWKRWPRVASHVAMDFIGGSFHSDWAFDIFFFGSRSGWQMTSRKWAFSPTLKMFLKFYTERKYEVGSKRMRLGELLNDKSPNQLARL